MTTFAVVLAVVGGLAPRAQAAAAVDDRGGEAIVISPSDEAPIASGDSRTPFSIRLPVGASCPGDSEDGQYRVQSFIVPEDVDPLAVQFKGLRPQVDRGWALYRTDTTTYMNAPTNKAGVAGGEGAIINIPSLSFEVFEPGMIEPGRYQLGIACSRFAETKRFWATKVDIIEDPAADPAGLRFSVVDPPDGARDGLEDDGPNGVAIGAGAVIAATAAVAVIVGRLRRPDGEGP